MSQRFCIREHDTTVRGRDTSGRCLECRSEVNRARPKRLSRPRLTPGERRARSLEGDRVRRLQGKPDGLEAEYGPVPPFVPEKLWYDQVAVDRTLSGTRPVGRRLTPLETSEVLRIKAEKDSLVEGLTWATIAG